MRKLDLKGVKSLVSKFPYPRLVTNILSSLLHSTITCFFTNMTLKAPERKKRKKEEKGGKRQAKKRRRSNKEGKKVERKKTR